MTIPQALELAVQRHQAGRLGEAEALYRQILAVKSNHADALHFLGLIAHQMGRHDEAAKLIRQAIFLAPNNPDAHSNLGVACRAMGRIDEAMAAFQRALEIKPDYADAWINLGTAFSDRGRATDAATAYRRALDLKPDSPEAHNNLGNALRDEGQLGEAMTAYRRAVELKPDYPEAHNNLGNILRELGRLEEADNACSRALELNPNLAEAHNNLGNALKDRGQLDEAIARFRRALELKPAYPDAHNNLGIALRDRGEFEEAIAECRHALQIKPEAAGNHSNLVFVLHFHPGYDARAIFEEQQRWNRRFSDPLKHFLQPHDNDRNPERNLRVGYVSPDFLDHAVARFALPLLERHDREQFEILCYSGAVRPDRMTDRFRALVGQWRNTVGVSDTQLAEIIRDDKVDILVDLTMHAARNRLPVFARQPAPVQVAWLAYPGSTGLHSIDYRLTDAHMDPPGDKPAWSAEEPVRLPDSWCCYQPADDSPEVNELPALSSAGVTFGSLNNFAKVNEAVLARWARVMNAVTDSRLLMLCPEGRARERVRAFFGAQRIEMERVELVGFLPRRDYLSLYHKIDLGLDPFPCNGMTTTCDALWMGAPVLTLPGKIPMSRAGLSLLSTVGLGEFVASSEEDYVRITVELAANLARLAELRAGLRPRMKASPLMDARRFARNIEAAYRSMWERWCAAQRPARARL